MAKTPAPIEERFWSHVNKTDTCWLWDHPNKMTGYGYFAISRVKQAKAHRFSYQISVGPIPDGLHVLHKCDNPPCVRPDHLFVGTANDNVQDKVQKGRQAIGSRHGQTKLTEEDVLQIRLRRKAKERLANIARAYGVSLPTIKRIVSGKTWRHI